MSEPIIEYRYEFNTMDFASKYADRISRVIDEQTLANVEHQLAMYGYVKVVRCHDCKYRYGCVHLVDNGDGDMRRCHATPDGFCSWSERRTDDNASSNSCDGVYDRRHRGHHGVGLADGGKG